MSELPVPRGGNVIIPRPRRWRFWAHMFEDCIHAGDWDSPILTLEEVVEKYRDQSIDSVPGVCKACRRICTLYRPTGYRGCGWCRTRGVVFSLDELWPYY